MTIQRALFSNEPVQTTNEKQTRSRKIVFKPYCQTQDFLLPKSVSDFITPGHIAQLIDVIIEKMDIDFIIKTYLGGGTSAYDPRMLLKSWILGFINRVYTSRILSKQLRENLTFIWISGNQQPDFHTLNNFRLRLKEDIKIIFKQIVRFALEKGIIEGKDVFVDHTKTEANANKHKIVWKKRVDNQLNRTDQELDQLFDYIDSLNEEEDKIFGDKDLPERERKGFDKDKVKEIVDAINNCVKEKKMSREKAREIKEKVRRTNELAERKERYEEQKKVLNNRKSYSKTDMDAVAMLMKDKLTLRPAYNEGIAVENGIVLNYVVSDRAADNVTFIPLMNGVIDNIEKIPENANGDGAYGNEENHRFLEEKGINNFLKYNSFRKERSKKWREKRVRFESFKYDKEQNLFVCPNGAELPFYKQRDEISATRYVTTASVYKAEDGTCTDCPFRAKCTESKSNARSLQVSWKAERLRQQAKTNLESEKGIELRTRRGNEVESVFGDAKLNGAKRRYLLRGLQKVNLEAGMYYITHNIRKIQRFLQEHPAESRVS